MATNAAITAPDKAGIGNLVNALGIERKLIEAIAMVAHVQPNSDHVKTLRHALMEKIQVALSEARRLLEAL